MPRTVRRRGMGAMPLPGLLTDVDQVTGTITNFYTGAVLGNCSSPIWGVLDMDCWGKTQAQWQAASQGTYVPPVAPTTDQVNEAIDTGTESDLIQSLTNQSILDTQAANLAAFQAIPDSSLSGCNTATDPFGCLGGLNWYWWALMAGGGVFAILLLQKR